MRELKPSEAQIFFSKLARYVGTSVEDLITREGGQFVFRVIKNRVYYMSNEVERIAHPVARKKLLGAGLLVGRFTHHGHFHIRITALPLLAMYAQYKIWLTPAAELSFLYKNDVMRSHIARMSDGIPENAGVVVFSADGQPIGFGVSTKAGVDAIRSDPGSKVVIHQGDVGEYLRDQDTMF